MFCYLERLIDANVIIIKFAFIVCYSPVTRRGTLLKGTQCDMENKLEYGTRMSDL